MATINRFEDLEVWKQAMDLCEQVYKLTWTPSFSKDFGLVDQIRRCSISVPSNISEGYERDSYKQFIYFLNIAKASCGELRTQLTIANRLGYINSAQYQNNYDLCTSVSKQIMGFSVYLKNFNENKK